MPRKSWREALATYANPATLALLLLGFAAGLPYMLVFSTLSVWLREAGVARETIGFASLIGLAYAFKWVWAPMLDQWRLPLLGKLGRRRSWLVLAQGLVAIGLIGMANFDPQTHLSSLIALAVLVAFASATQDIAVDAYRLEILGDEHQAALAAAYMTGYRVAALLATAGALYFAEGFGSTAKDYQFSAWTGTYLVFALLMLPGLLTSIWMREPAAPTPIQATPPKHGFFHQLLSILAVIVLVISVPTMFIQFYQSDLLPMLMGNVSAQELLYNDRAFLRALLYTALTCVCASGLFWGGLAPVLKTAAAKYGFFHQLLSVLLLIILLISIPAMATQFYESDLSLVFQGQMSLQDLLYYDRAFLRALLYTLLTGLSISSLFWGGMAPVLTPVNDFILRYRWQALLLLSLIATYRLSDTVMGVMANVFYIDQGFTKEQIASVSKIFGLIMTLLGAGAGGLLIVRFGIMPILFAGALASAATNLLFMALVGMGAHLQMLVVTISCDNFSAGLATSAFVAYLSSLTNLKFSATQYALLSSIMLLLPRLIGGYSGVMVEKLGYAHFFLATALMGVPTLLLIVLQWRRDLQAPPEAEEPPTLEKA
ncbi:MFS transporter, PAT family, beta-lactamase induction signal transducer AmpG [Pseudomonas sp. 8Z]|uniref:AmpG family muropeptide MFS transporter n=1 Tax=Pseudomonas sp. 8Z TaxID=2653166 RepID=UPI0012F43321|nr:AmpG family muropeptide MFS transporter [Pseudomonas sp. 8Z]VXD02664.1 MFS transporter, PAT family, beta-lactamase induction signal transducer AmpG [Pseudomonas sp. 8Z]